mgnify:CR=1 FL=1
MPFTPVGANQGDPENVTYVNPKDQIGHLLMVWPVRYETDTYTKYPRRDGLPSDAVYCDVVDLNLADENGYAGKLMRQCKWTQGRLIRDTKRNVGAPDPMLVRMGMDGDAYIIVDMTSDANAVALAEAWLAAHPEFKPGDSSTEPAPVNRPQSAPPAPQPATNATMDRLRRAAENSQLKKQEPLPPPPPYPGSGQQEGNPPF